MPDSPSPRKPPSRFWLFAPYGLTLAAALVWSAYWLVLSQSLERRMDETAQALRQRGWVVEWASRRIGGYPFRLDLDLESPRLAEPSGWGLSAPALKTEAFAFAPDHWVLLAPQGVTLTRPGRGAVAVGGQVLRASVEVSRQSPVPRVSIEGLSLVFTPAGGARPLPIAGCDHLGLHLRPVDGDQAEFQLDLKGASPTPGGLMARLDGGRAMDVVWDQTLTQASSLRGPNWPAAVRAWSAAGGTLSLVHGEADAQGFGFTGSSGRMTIGEDGRPQGEVSLKLNRIDAASGPLAPALAAASLFKAQLELKDGGLFLGPFKLADAPKVY